VSGPSSDPIFPRLSSGPRKMEAEAVARHQRGRLEGAMVDAVARHGYWNTTLQELVTLARVSKATFYEHFDSKQDCFLRTFDDIVDEGARQVAEAFDRPGELGDRLLAGLTRLTSLAAEEEEAAYLATVESLALGAAAVPHRDRAALRFERLIRGSFDQSTTQAEVSDLTVRGIVAGLRNCVYRRLRTETVEELPEMAEPISRWVLGYSRPPGEAARRGAAAAASPTQPGPAADPDGDGAPGWDEPPDSERCREELDKRERILRAAARVGVEKGYEALSIPAISTAAAVSNQTFYDHFPGKREAFVAAFDALAANTLSVAGGAFAVEQERPGSGRPEAIGVGLRALLDHIASDRLFARMAFFELPTAGPGALDHADNVLGGFTAYLEAEPGAPGSSRPVPKVIGDAIVGGVWAVIQHEIHSGRLSELPLRAPQIAEFTMSPFDD
jgi:AcrR family transcriptional regulator